MCRKRHTKRGYLVLHVVYWSKFTVLLNLSFCRTQRGLITDLNEKVLECVFLHPLSITFCHRSKLYILIFVLVIRHRSATITGLGIDLCDLTAATSLLGYHHLNNGALALVGCIGSAIDIYATTI